MKSVITIGRSSRCDIIVPHDSISREHARISIVGGCYVYEDVGKNGSVIGGRIIHGERITVAAGADILLAGKVPLPWAQVYAMLPLKGVRPYQGETRYEPVGSSHYGGAADAGEPGIGVGWAILAFFVPIAGWIMYFVWRDRTPRRASQASVIAWVGFALNLISVLSAL